MIYTCHTLAMPQHHRGLAINAEAEMRAITAQTQDQIGQVLDYVHDQRFKLDDIKFDSGQGVLRIPVEVNTKKRWTFLGMTFEGKGKSIATLVFRNATGWRILEDKAQIGYGDINRIFAREDSVLVEGSLPVNIEVDVTSLNIELIGPDELRLA